MTRRDRQGRSEAELLPVHIAIHVAQALISHRKKAQGEAHRHASRPAPQMHGPDGSVFADARWEQLDGARAVRLRLQGGEVRLTLCEPRPGDAAAGHDAVIEAAGPERGSAFLVALARWLGEPLSRRPDGPRELSPFALRWSPAPGTRTDLERIRLSFRWKELAAEVCADFRANGPMVRLERPADGAIAPLLAILTVVLRDGPPA